MRSGCVDHRVPDPVVVSLGDEVGEEPRQIGDRHRDRRQSAAVLGDRALLPFAAEDVADVGEVLLEERMMRPDVADARPALQLAAAQDGGVLAGAAVIPAARAAHLPAELHERHVERRLHQAPLALQEDRARHAHVLRVAVVRGDGDRLLLAGERARELAREDFHHDRLDHRASVDLDVAAERVDDVASRHPRHRAVDGVLGDAVAPVLDERLPVRHGAREVDGEVFVEGHAVGIIGCAAAIRSASCGARHLLLHLADRGRWVHAVGAGHVRELFRAGDSGGPAWVRDGVGGGESSHRPRCRNRIRGRSSRILSGRSG